MPPAARVPMAGQRSIMNFFRQADVEHAASTSRVNSPDSGDGEPAASSAPTPVLPSCVVRPQHVAAEQHRGESQHCKATALSCRQDTVSSTRSPAAAQCFAVGDSVMARYSNGEFYPAVVEERSVELDQVKFRVAWDDGDSACRGKIAPEMMHRGDYEMLQSAANARDGKGQEEEARAPPPGPAVAAASDGRPKREVVKRKRLIEDDDFDSPGVKRELLARAIKRLKAAASALAHQIGHLLAGWSGTKSNFSVGDTVMARYSDGEWYAAEVEEQLVEFGEVKFRVAWDDGDSENVVKRAKDMMPLEDFTKRAEKALERRKRRASEAAAAVSKDDAGKEGKTGQAKEKEKEKEKEKVTSAAVYTFKGLAGVDSGAAFHRRYALTTETSKKRFAKRDERIQQRLRPAAVLDPACLYRRNRND
jgi:hypothetical protein